MNLPKNLTAKQKLFCKNYLIDLNATQAAIRAGYSKKTAHVIGPENLEKPILREYIQLQLKNKEKKVDISAEWVLENLKELCERCMQKTAVLDAQGKKTGVWRFDSRGANKSLELLGRYLSLFSENINHKFDFTFAGMMKALSEENNGSSSRTDNFVSGRN